MAKQPKTTVTETEEPADGPASEISSETGTTVPGNTELLSSASASSASAGQSETSSVSSETEIPSGAASTIFEPAFETCFRITAPGGSRWRAGLEFGRVPVLVGLAELEAAGQAKGMSVEDVVARLHSDPLLAIASAERPRASA